MNSNVDTEPTQLMLTRLQVQKWLGIPRKKIDAIVAVHPEIIYRETPRGRRYFRKKKVKQILLGE